MEIGIGISTGDCVVGNMGSDIRFDYSVLGDSVNLALPPRRSDCGLRIADIGVSGDGAALQRQFARWSKSTAFA